MADISRKIVDDCAIFTGVSDAGRAWMRDQCKASSAKFALTTAVEKAQAARLLKRAKLAGLKVAQAAKK